MGLRNEGDARDPREAGMKRKLISPLDVVILLWIIACGVRGCALEREQEMLRAQCVEERVPVECLPGEAP